MKKLFFAIILSGLCLPGFARDYNIASPDGAVKAIIGDNLEYTVTYNGETAYTGVAALTLSNGKTLATVKSPKKTSVDATIESQFYRSSTIADKYNQLTFKADKDWNIVFRAYNDGLVYRWVYTGKKPVNVVNEKIEYTFANDAHATVPYVRDSHGGDIEKQFFNSFENLYTEGPVSKLDPKRLAFLPLVVEPAGKVKVLFTESDIANYPGLYLNHAAGTTLTGIHPRVPKKEHVGGYINIQKVVDEREDYIAALDGARTLPWRIAIITAEDKGLAQSQLTYILGTPGQLDDVSWIKPGKVAWDWWNAWNLYDVDFEAGINQKTYQYYIDFAARNGIEYIIMDDGWSVPGCGELFSVIPEIDMPGLVKYAADKGVGIILWAGYVPFEKDLEAVCKHYSEMGVKGFKVDFFDRNDQKMTAFLDKAAATAAKYHMVLDLHGSHIPAGINRKWPNVLNTEGVNGLENMKWNDESYDQMRYDATIPFVRQAGGPMDYTQGAMINGAKGKFRPINDQPMSQGTRSHQLGLYPVLDSPLNMLCDSPSNYMREPECTAYIAQIPTVWDETIILDGDMGEYIVTARRKGNDWYIGGITNWTPRDVTVDLSFLPEGTYVADWYVDGVNAHRNGNDYKHYTETISKKTKTIHMAPGGGFAGKITKK